MTYTVKTNGGQVVGSTQTRSGLFALVNVAVGREFAPVTITGKPGQVVILSERFLHPKVRANAVTTVYHAMASDDIRLVG